MDEETIKRIANDHLGIATLATRNRARLDIHEVSVANIRSALKAAYEAGQRSRPIHLPADRTPREPTTEEVVRYAVEKGVSTSEARRALSRQLG